MSSCFWLVKIASPQAIAEAIAETFGEGALAVTVLSPPRQETAHVEFIFDHSPDIADLDLRLALFAASVQIPPLSFIVEKVPRVDWLKKVAKDFPPIKIARWTIYGATDRRRIPSRLNALKIEATNAFGTGEHPTTRGCLLMLEKLLKAGFVPRRIADIGCGSGILAMGCVKATRCKAVAVDLDPISVQIAAQNIRTNGLGTRICVRRGCGYAAPLIAASTPYDLIMANIFAGPLCAMAKDLKKHLALNGIAILSGLLTSQSNKVIAAHRRQGLILTERLTLGEWSVLAFKRQYRA